MPEPRSRTPRRDSAAARTSVDPFDAFRILARVEPRSSALRDLRRPDRGWMRRGRVLVRGDRDPATVGIDLAGDRWEPIDGLPALAADAVILSNQPGRRLACRAFYRDAGVTAALQGVSLRPSRLLAGSRVATRFAASRDPLVPHQLERGRTLRHAWVVEEYLPGARATRAAWPDLVARVVEGVTGLWRTGAHARPRAVRQVVPWMSALRVRELIELMELDPTAADRLEATVERLASGPGQLLVGWTHGDPVPNNVLLMADDRLALVDWERARQNPLGLDACRMLAALDEPHAAIALLERRFATMRTAGALPIREQAAAALIGLLPIWARQRGDWHEAGRQAGYRVRNRRRLRLLEALLEA